MNVLRHTDADFAARVDQLAAASSLFDPVIEQRARDYGRSLHAARWSAVRERCQNWTPS